MASMLNGGDSDDDRASLLLLSMGFSKPLDALTEGLRALTEKANGAADAGGGGGRPKHNANAPDFFSKYVQSNGRPAAQVNLCHLLVFFLRFR
jgi:hypothetical protein